MYFLINRGNLAFHARMISFAAQRKKETTENEKGKEKLKFSGYFVGRNEAWCRFFLFVSTVCLAVEPQFINWLILESSLNAKRRAPVIAHCSRIHSVAPKPQKKLRL